MTIFEYYKSCSDQIKSKGTDYKNESEKELVTQEDYVFSLLNMGRALGLQDARDILMSKMEEVQQEHLQRIVIPLEPVEKKSEIKDKGWLWKKLDNMLLVE